MVSSVGEYEENGYFLFFNSNVIGQKVLRRTAWQYRINLYYIKSFDQRSLFLIIQMKKWSDTHTHTHTHTHTSNWEWHSLHFLLTLLEQWQGQLRCYTAMVSKWFDCLTVFLKVHSNWSLGSNSGTLLSRNLVGDSWVIGVCFTRYYGMQPLSVCLSVFVSVSLSVSVCLSVSVSLYLSLSFSYTYVPVCACVVLWPPRKDFA